MNAKPIPKPFRALAREALGRTTAWLSSTTLLVLPACRALATTPVASESAAPSSAIPAQELAEEVAPISTDRPGFLFAPTLVPLGRLQVETGLPTLGVLRDAGDEARAYTLPVALRYGLSEALELRASLPTWTEARTEVGASSARDEGFGDAEVGAKLALPPLAGGPLAVLGSMRLPTGAEDFTTDEVGGSALLLHGRDVSGFWLQTMAGVSHVPIAGAHDQTNGALAALVSHPLGADWSAYVEATAFPGLSHAAGQSYLGSALIWTTSHRVQLDLSADFGLDDDSADVIAAFGLSWYF